MSTTDFFISQLRNLDPRYGFRMRGDHGEIRCPYHASGNERTPSCGVLLHPKNGYSPGVFRCLACGEKGGWNKLAEKVGMEKIASNGEGISTFTWPSECDLEKALQRDTVHEAIDKLPRWPSHQSWRGIEGRVLRAFDARVSMHGKEMFMFLPAREADEFIGGVHCRIKREDKSVLGYVNTVGTWSSSHLLGITRARKMRGPVAVVEGPRDMLALGSVKMRVVALLGTNNASNPAKLHTLLELDPPFVVVATDDDEAGNKAADEIKRFFRMHNVKIMRVTYPREQKDRDPAGLSFEHRANLAVNVRQIWNNLEAKKYLEVQNQRPPSRPAGRR